MVHMFSEAVFGEFVFVGVSNVDPRKRSNLK